MRVLFDHNLSPKLARCLNGLTDDYVYPLKDIFPINIKDIDLINSLNSLGGWIIISGDRRITRNKAEKHALQNSNIKGFFLSSGLYKDSVLKKAERLIVLWPEITRLAETAKIGSMFELPLRSTQIRCL